MVHNVSASEPDRGENMTIKLTTIKCPFGCIDPATGEVFEWVPRVANPVRCPNCTRRLARAKKTLLKREEKQSTESVLRRQDSVDGGDIASLPTLVENKASIDNKENKENKDAN